MERIGKPSPRHPSAFPPQRLGEKAELGAGSQQPGIATSLNSIHNATEQPSLGAPGTLSLQGTEMFAPPKKASTIVTDMEKWRAMRPDERAETSLAQFADENNRSRGSLRNVLHADGTLTSLGRARQKRREMGEKRRGKRCTPITAEHVKKWCDMPPELRALTSLAKFALAEKISLQLFNNLVRVDGTLKNQGKHMLAKAASCLSATTAQEGAPVVPPTGPARTSRAQFSDANNMPQQDFEIPEDLEFPEYAVYPDALESPKNRQENQGIPPDLDFGELAL